MADDETAVAEDGDNDDAGIDILNVIVSNKSGKVLGEHYLTSIQCNHCKKLLREPYQLLECGHRVCKQCIPKLSQTKSGIQLCPACNIAAFDDDIKPDRAVQRELLKLQARCQATGCSWEGPLLELERHLRSCALLEAPCKLGCGVTMIRQDLSHHYVTDCRCRKVSCQYCSIEVKFELKEDHYSDCEYVPVVCEQCNKEVSKIKLKEHQLLLCPVSVVKCNFSTCSHQDKLSDIGDHYKQHMLQLIKLVQFCHKAIDGLSNDRAKIQKTVNKLEETVLNYQRQASKMQSKVKRVAELEDTIEELKEELDQVKMASSLANVQSSCSSNELRSIDNQVVKIKQDVMIVKSSTEEAQETAIGFKKQMIGLVDTVQSIRETTSRHAVAIGDVKLRQDILDVKTINGIFVWKVPEISRRHREAKERRTLSLYSPPFQTSPHGYRMCIRTYLNGDGSGKEEYVSIFFVLMKSEHDDVLLWPFRQPVTFELLGQTNKAKTTSETFMPDDVSPSFQKPEREMNVASGFPKFAKQSVLRDMNYTKDDAIFIRCKVDTKNMQCE